MTDGQEYDSLEVLLAEWKPCPCSQCQVEVQLGIHRATVLAWLPTQLLEEVGMGPWQPKELLKCVNCLGQYGGALWGELLQALAPCLQQEELAPALTDEVVAEALGGDLLQACRWLAQGGQAGQLLFGQCVTAGPLCAALLAACARQGWWSWARRWLQWYVKATPMPGRPDGGWLLAELARQWGGRPGTPPLARLLQEGLDRLPPPDRARWRRQYGRLLEEGKDGPAPWPPGPSEGRRISAPAPENIREVLEYRLQKLCPCRPVRQGGLFFDLVLLENGTPGLPHDSIPLWNATGSRKSRLALARLPAHQRNMVRQLQAGGHRVFACVDPLCSMPEMQLWTVSLWWQADIKFFQPIEKEDGISTERGKNI